MPIILKRSKTLIQNIFANHLNFNSQKQMTAHVTSHSIHIHEIINYQQKSKSTEEYIKKQLNLNIEISNLQVHQDHKHKD